MIKKFFQRLRTTIGLGLLIPVITIGLTIVIPMMLMAVIVGIGVLELGFRLLGTFSLFLADLLSKIGQISRDSIIGPLIRWLDTFVDTKWFLVFLGLFMAFAGLLGTIDWVKKRRSKMREVQDAKRQSHP